MGIVEVLETVRRKTTEAVKVAGVKVWTVLGRRKIDKFYILVQLPVIVLWEYNEGTKFYLIRHCGSGNLSCRSTLVFYTLVCVEESDTRAKIVKDAIYMLSQLEYVISIEGRNIELPKAVLITNIPEVVETAAVEENFADDIYVINTRETIRRAEEKYRQLVS